MMRSFNQSELQYAPIETLNAMMMQINQEILRRQNEELEKAIKAFNDAFVNLRNLNVIPVYSTDEEEVYLEDTDRFTFNY